MKTKKLTDGLLLVTNLEIITATQQVRVVSEVHACLNTTTLIDLLIQCQDYKHAYTEITLEKKPYRHHTGEKPPPRYLLTN